MTNPFINAHISEIDTGISYQVKLFAIPKVGEIIDLTSFVELAADKTAKKYYEVVQVMHSLHDWSENIPLSKDGAHSVTIFVKNSDSDLFNK